MEFLALGPVLENPEGFPNNTLSVGISNASLNSSKKHPVQIMQEEGLHRAEIARLNRLSNAFGGHAALKAQIENNLLASSRRLPGLPSSLMGLQVHMGLNDTILSEEVFGRETPEVPYAALGLHEYIEKQWNV